MLKLRTFVGGFMTILLTGSALANPAARPAAFGPTKTATVAASHVLQGNGPATLTVTPGVRTIAAWACALSSYRTACGLVGFGETPFVGAGPQTESLGDNPDGIDPYGIRNGTRGGGLPDYTPYHP